jgi:hypothetical protein
MLATLSIDSGGIITDPLVDHVTFDSSTSVPWEGLQISTAVYALVYNAPGPVGVLITFNVDPDGYISDPYVDKFIFATPSGTALSICHAGSDIYVLGHVRAGSYPWLTTVRISQAGDIGPSSLDDLQVLGFGCGKPQVHYISPGIIAYALRGASGDGFIYTFTIDTSTGAITATPISSLEFDTTNCDLPVIFDISHGIYAIAYTGPSNHGYLKTLGISTPLHLIDHTPFVGIGP